MPRVLAIETSCDETAAAVVADRQVKSNIIASQQVHRQWGGIVPELASRAHLERISDVLRAALEDAKVHPSELDAVACTVRPGLAGSLVVGASFAKGIAVRWNIPCVPVHHLEGHLLSGYLVEPNLPMPAVVLVASGGHTLLFVLDASWHYRLIGSTRDDAAGEAFDKIATLLGLEYPGGPALERLAALGTPRIPLPRPLLRETGYEFSFSGLKTAVRRFLAARQSIDDQLRADLAASAQQAIIDVLVTKTIAAARQYAASSIVIAGGVAANQSLQRAMRQHAASLGIPVVIPDRQYVLDNAAMIGLVAHIKLELHGREQFRRLDFEIDPTPWRIHRHGSAKNQHYEEAVFSL
jgi:N6-L-threonylcarbamoyladenine synthase